MTPSAAVALPSRPTVSVFSNHHVSCQHPDHSATENLAHGAMDDSGKRVMSFDTPRNLQATAFWEWLPLISVFWPVRSRLLHAHRLRYYRPLLFEQVELMHPMFDRAVSFNALKIG